MRPDGVCLVEKSVKRIIPWLIVMTVLFIVGCGGGGGGGDTSGGGSGGGTYTNLQIGAMVGGTFVDPANVMVGETVVLTVYGRNESGALVAVPASGWTTNAPSSVATLSGSGALTGIGSSGSTGYTVSASAAGNSVSASLAIKPVQARVAGKLLNNGGAGMRFSKVIFYNAAGTQVGSATTGVDGMFRGVVPTSATQFTLDIEATDPTNLYYRQFSFGTDDFLMGEASCYAPLPALTTGAQASLSSLVLSAKSAGPPPPPTGCVG